MRRIFLVLLFLMSSLTLASCNQLAKEELVAADYSFTDALNRPITGKASAEGAALMGSFAEIWQLAGGQLLGATEDAFEEGRLEALEDIRLLGQFNNPNLEEIMTLSPDILLLSAETQAHVALKDTLTGAGVNAAYFSVTYFEDYLDMLAVCTDITGRKDLYKENGLAVAAQIDEIKAQAETLAVPSAPKVLLMITYSGGGAIQDSATMTGRMLKELGCENIGDKEDLQLADYNIEAILKEDPDFIFVIPMGNDDEQARRYLKEATENNPAWNGLSAVVNGRYILLPKELFLYKPNVRWNESYEYLFSILAER